MNNIKKLGLGIVAFDATEHLCNIISEIKDLVDYVVVGLQKVSYHGDPISPVDYNEVKRLRDEDDLVDEIIEIDLDNSLEARVQETNKRNALIEACKKQGCTHCLIIDSDEYYVHDSFKKALEKIDAEDIQISYCQYVNYWKDYQHYLAYPFKDGMYVPFVARTDYKFKYESQDFKRPSDPTRRYFIPAKSERLAKDAKGNKVVIKERKFEPFVFDWKDLKMHHLSWVRANIRKKLNNWSSKKLFKNFEDLIDKSVDSFDRFSSENPDIVKQADLLFNTPGHKVDIMTFPRQYINPKFDINTRLRSAECKKKIAWLILSTDNDFTRRMEDIIRETLGRDLVEHPNIKMFFITESDNEKDYVEGNYIKVRCDKEYSQTFYKFFRALQLLKEVYPDYEYILRTNTSTWVNLEAVDNFIARLDNDACNYASMLVACKRSGYDLYMQGNGFIIPRRTADIVEDLAIKHGVTYTNRNVGTDDYMMSCLLAHRLKNLGIDYTTHFKSIGCAFMKNPDIDENLLTTDVFYNMFIQIKTFVDNNGHIIESNDYNARNTEPLKFRFVNDQYHKNKISGYLPDIAKTVMSFINEDIVVCTGENFDKYGDYYNGWHTNHAIRHNMDWYKDFINKNNTLCTH